MLNVYWTERISMPVKFPPVHEASPEGLLAIGGDLSSSTLEHAYLSGIFPWPISKDSPLTWFSPDPRGILKVEDFHVSRSLKRFLNNHPYELRYNFDFESVIMKCAEVSRSHESGTWITQEIIDGYTGLFNEGHAYCVGVYEEDQLVGGLYGVCFGAVISGESMFHLRDNASKLCLYAIMSILHQNKIPFLDTQMVTGIVENFGGIEIPRNQFLTHLEKLKTIKTNRDLLFQSKPSVPNQLF